MVTGEKCNIINKNWKCEGSEIISSSNEPSFLAIMRKVKATVRIEDQDSNCGPRESVLLTV
jgi:hypothetical protein